MDAAKLEALAAGMPDIRQAPSDAGTVRLLVRRPAIGEREVLDEGTFDLDEGLVGDNWKVKGSKSSPDGKSDPRAQVTVTSWRGMKVVAATVDEIPLAGDQIYADLDLSVDNLPAGTLLRIGAVVLEVSDKPHKGCEKFMGRFGKEALRFVNTGEGGRRRLRGINCYVRAAGVVRVGDAIAVERPVTSEAAQLEAAISD